MKQRLTIFISFLICIGIISFFSPYLLAQTPSATAIPSTSNTSDLESKIQELEKKLTEVKSQKNTLSAQISYMDTQMHLAELRINETEEKIVNSEKEINVLGVRISSLDNSLDTLSKQLLERIVAGYKNRDVTLVDLVLDSKNTSKLVNRLKYYDLARNRNQKSLLQVQEAKSNFIEQKDLREKKVEQLDELQTTLQQQKVVLDQQKDQKKKILTDTQNSESVYQNLLQQAKAEYVAIQQITSGGGSETELRNVTKGETIATLISGKSCNSNGRHLHFIVKEGDSVIDPFSKLKSVDYVNDSNGDAFNPSGSWDWPLPPTISLHQGFGNTWFVRTYSWYPSHNGIDITGASNNVSAVEDGTLYKGTYSGFNGCALSYVRLQHKDSNISTLYLHVYPN
ncbi:hypothetical protein CO051_01870 [Candidatus Roizmanbacteria bacterium CG_4_9_14_0_2_um_filter_39_13]|uniref:Peptidase M23 domain-containing protein n=1 Tax=Candidatus Roizmanbacteria bacterium CG_4_9_14_0_2_um_filter_39_13 TaxID=1974839 RepID=A0A2M8F1S2_9BACT|nr:MAG: hypothetical protein CO051_01870 [Candidatus Roizmanbacteria bacterium CG_4_9_14_0_2_um_filter_39_13]